MIIKYATAGFSGDTPRVTLLGPRGAGLVKLASVMPEVESFTARIPKDDADNYWLHVIALTASEYYGQNRNGDHWGIEGLSYLPEGWTGSPDTDRDLARSVTYGPATFYEAHVFPHHLNKAVEHAIGDVELVLWNPKQFWVELVIRLNKAKTAQSKVKWVLDRISRNAPFDLSMGAKVPFDMATVGDMRTYREAQQSFDRNRHRSPADAVLEVHRRLQAERGDGILGLSITRDDYIDICKNQMGDVLPDGRRVGVRNDYSRYFDISVVYVGADKVAKSISKIAAAGVLGRAIRRHSPVSQAIFGADEMLKAAALKGAAEIKEGDIEKEVNPAFDEKSIRVLAGTEPDLPDTIVERMRTYPSPERVLSTLSSLGIVLKPGELSKVLGDREIPQMDDSLFDPTVASWLMGTMKHRSALAPSLESRLGRVMRYDREPEYNEPDDRYKNYRNRTTIIIEGAPSRVFERNPDLWLSLLGRRSQAPLVSEATKKYARLAYLPRLDERRVQGVG